MAGMAGRRGTRSTCAGFSVVVRGGAWSVPVEDRGAAQELGREQDQGTKNPRKLGASGLPGLSWFGMPVINRRIWSYRGTTGAGLCGWSNVITHVRSFPGAIIAHRSLPE
jgi:hypothetical protein